MSDEAFHRPHKAPETRTNRIARWAVWLSFIAIMVAVMAMVIVPAG